MEVIQPSRWRTFMLSFCCILWHCTTVLLEMQIPDFLAKTGTFINETFLTVMLLESWKTSSAHIVLSSCYWRYAVIYSFICLMLGVLTRLKCLNSISRMPWQEWIRIILINRVLKGHNELVWSIGNRHIISIFNIFSAISVEKNQGNGINLFLLFVAWNWICMFLSFCMVSICRKWNGYCF